MNSTKIKITLNGKQIELLNKMARNRPGTIINIVYWHKGHGGHGLYAYYDQSPQEGTIFLGDRVENRN